MARHYGYQMPATRKSVDEAPIDGSVDSWTKYTFDDSWHLTGYESNAKGGNEANIFAEYTWSADGHPPRRHRQGCPPDGDLGLLWPQGVDQLHEHRHDEVAGVHRVLHLGLPLTLRG